MSNHRARMRMCGNALILLVASVLALADSRTNNELTESARIDNLVAFAKLVGYIRFFHPSDQAVGIDWDQRVIAGVDRVELAASSGALRAALYDVFGPIAPSLVIGTGTPPKPDSALPPSEAHDVVGYRHFGVGLSPAKNSKAFYQSERVRATRGSADASTLAPEGTVVVKTLARGLWCRIPISLFADASGTLPHAPAPAPLPAERPIGFTPSGADRSTRIADVILAWTVFRHFYPYDDVAHVAWDDALREALAGASRKGDDSALFMTLGTLVAALKDGHGHVRHDGVQRSMRDLPIEWTWASDTLVATEGHDDDANAVHRGDIVLAIDGVPVDDAYRTVIRTISAATDAWRRERARRELRHFSSADPGTVRVRRGGKERTIAIPRVDVFTERHARPAQGAELAPGIVYFYLGGASDADLARAMPRLAGATGIVFDLRGYPGAAGQTLLRHLALTPILGPQMHVPRPRIPDLEDMAFEPIFRWHLEPASPHLAAKLAFLIDGRAISYAESVLATIEHMKVGALVGEPTAGTNGDINPFTLPGGYTVSWTGMRVLKHDGSRHHGVGIVPTVAVHPTPAGIAAGRDEILERAIDVLMK